MAGTDTFIQLPADGIGKRVRAWSNVIGSDTVYAQALTPTGPDGEILASANGLIVQGNVASGATDAGSPVKIGSRYNTTQPTLTNGQRGDSQADTRGNLKVAIMGLDTASAASLFGTQYAEDAALGSTPTGTLAMGRRTDTMATLTPVVDDAVGLKVSSRGALWVTTDGLRDATGSGTSAFGIPGDGASPKTGIPVNAQVSVYGGSGVYNIARDANVGDAAGAAGITAAAGMLYNGASWDRLRGDTGGLFTHVNETTSSGSLTAAAQTLLYSPRGRSTVIFTVSNTYVGTIQFEGTRDGSTWVALNCRDSAGNNTLVSSTTTVGHYAAAVSGYIQVRARASAFSVGVADIVAQGVWTPTEWVVSNWGSSGVASTTGPTPVLKDGASGTPVFSLRGSNSTDGLINYELNTADGTSASSWNAMRVSSRLQAYNGSTYDRVRSVAGDAASTGLLAGGAYGYNGTNWDRFRTIESVSAAPNVKTGVQAVGVGPGFDIKLNPSNLGTAVSSQAAVNVDGAAQVAYYIGTTTTGSFFFEVTADDSTWTSATVYNLKTGAFLAAGTAITPTSGDVYAVLAAGWRQVRIRVQTGLGATLAYKTTHTRAVRWPPGPAIGSTIASDHPGTVVVGVNSSTAKPLQLAAGNVDPVIAQSADHLLTVGGILLDGNSGWERARTSSADFLATTGITASGPMVWNGSSYDRVREVIGDGQAVTGLVASGLMGYNGSTYDRVRVANTGRLQVDVVTGGSTQYVEDVAFGGNGTGMLVVARRDDALSTLTPVEDDAVGLRVNNRGALWMKHDGNIVADAGTGPWPVTDNAGSLTVDAPVGTPVFARLSDGTSALTTTSGRLAVDASGVAVPITDNAGSLTVDAPVGTPVAVRISDGAAFVTTTNGLLVDTEMPAAAALADATTNPTTPIVGVASEAFNGTSWDRVRTIDGFKTAAASPDVGLLGVSTADRRFTSVSLGTAVAATQTWDCAGADEATVRCGTSTTGTYTFEVSFDGSNFSAAEVRKTSDNTWQSGVNLTPTSGDTFRVHTTGVRTMRVKTVTALGATVAFITNLANNSSIWMAVRTGPPPHDFGYAIVTKTAQYTSTQTGTALWTPASGRRVVVTYMQIQVGGTTAGTTQVWFGATADTTFTRGTDKAIFDGEFAPSATLKPGVVAGNGLGAIGVGAVDDVLRVTDSAAINPITVTVWGYETV